MLILKLAVKSLLTQKARPFIMIAQILIGFIALTLGLGIIEGTQSYINDVKHLVSSDTIKIAPRSEDSDISSERLHDFYEKLKTDNHVLKTGTFLVKNINIQYQGTLLEDIKVIFVDPYFLNSHLFSTTNNINLSSLYKTEEKFMIVGSQIAKNIPLGAEVTIGIADDKKMQIVSKSFKCSGLLENNNIFWKGSSTEIDNNIMKIDNAIILPMQPEHNYGASLQERIMYNMFIELKDPSQKDAFCTSLKKSLSDVGINANVVDIQTLIDRFNRQNRVQIIFAFAFASLLLLLACFGLLGVILSSLIYRKKEFGVYYSLGATQKTLMLIVLGEIFILLFSAAFLAIMLMTTIIQILPESDMFKLGLQTILSISGIMLFLCTLSCILPLLKISKIEPIHLIGGNE